MIDTDKYEGHTEGKWDVTMDDTMEGYYFFRQGYDREQEEDCDYDECHANARLMSDAPLILEAYKRLRGLLDEIDDVVYYNDEKAGQVLPVEKPNLELLRDIMMSYIDEAYQIRGDEGEWIE